MDAEIAFSFVNEDHTFNFFHCEISALLNFYRKHYNAKISDHFSICVAVSGGPDSVALLFLANFWAKQNGVNMVCVTVDHCLRKESYEEAKFVGDLCKLVGVKHKILTWNRKTSSISSGKLENLARNARYELISDFCKEESISILLTGHTWNDQLETYEMRKSCGSLESGLACISRVRSLTNELKLLRPLLHFFKDHLKNFLIHKKISWKLDPMNEQSEFKRVFFRQKINSYNQEVIRKNSREIMNFGKIRNEIETIAVSFLKTFCEFSEFGYAAVELIPFLSENNHVQMEILKRVIWNIGGKKYATTVNDLVLRKIINKKISTLGRCLLKIKKDKIFLFRENRNIEEIIVPSNVEIPTTIFWDNRFLIKIPANVCNLSEDLLDGRRQKISNEEKFVNVELNSYTIKSLRQYDKFKFEIPKEALIGLPCVFQNHEVKYTIMNLPLGSIRFTNKVNLFDIFL
ncbi:MAG: tRNA lysidine(34) synthetase TilS [Holosporaceae bacterium]|jgi:tRNA(Ile)-lysidine synthase|nr:tRNA lysidine(34) synthetase TilS [Holosporaceae bacterium]